MMEYQKINLFDKTPNQPSKFKTKIGSKNDESQRMYNKDNQIRLKTLMLSAMLSDYSQHIHLLKAL